MTKSLFFGLGKKSVALLLVALPIAHAQEDGPVLAYETPEATATARLDGEEVVVIPKSLNSRFSIGAGIVAGTTVTSRTRRVMGFNARSGERLFRIPNAMNPIALPRGRVAFLGYGKRDRFANSLWIRRKSGRVRRVARFSAGAGTPGVKTGMKGENVMLDVAFDAAGKKAAVVQGNDLDLFIYDIWVIDTIRGEVRRLTRGQHSRHASMSPDGSRVAYVNEQTFCGGPAPGYRAGPLTVKNSTGGGKTIVAHGDCDVHFVQPRWLDDSTLIARRLTHVEGRELRASEIVSIGVGTAEVSVLAASDEVGLFTVSPSLSRIAYEIYTEAEGFYLLDPTANKTLHFEQGNAPRLSGEHRIVY